MKKQAHTPGPWGFMDDPIEGIWVESSHGGFCIAEIPKQTAGLDNDASPREANARLIAAAPETKEQRDDLLSALKKMSIAYEKLADTVGDAGPHWTIYREAKAAITKAEGS